MSAQTEKLRFCNKQYLCTLSLSPKMEFHLKNINPSDLDNNADSDLSTDIYYKISETLFRVTRSHLKYLKLMNCDNNDM